MIVDDSKFIGLTTKRSLEEISLDYSIIFVNSGDTCLKLLEHNEFDLILLDIIMPDMNGWQVFKKIRENKQNKNTQIAFLTSNEDEFSKALGKMIGNAYIQKGISIQELKNKIEDIINNPIKLDESKEKLIENALKNIIVELD